jgi:hypothetical protein
VCQKPFADMAALLRILPHQHAQGILPFARIDHHLRSSTACRASSRRSGDPVQDPSAFSRCSALATVRTAHTGLLTIAA